MVNAMLGGVVMDYRIPGAVALIVAGVACGDSFAQGPSVPPVQIRLSALAEVRTQDVRLDDVAQLTADSRSREIAERLAALDIAEVSKRVERTILSKSVIDLQLQLSGITPDEYELSGPEFVVISYRPPPFAFFSTRQVSPVSHSRDESSSALTSQKTELSDLALEDEVTATLQREFRLSRNEVSAKLLQPFFDSRMRKLMGRDLRIEVMPPPSFPYGRAGIRIRIWDGNHMVSSGTASMEIRRKQRLLVARRKIMPLKPITADMIGEETRYVDRLHDEVPAADVEGMMSRRSILAGQPIAVQDLAPIKAGKRTPLISPRDSVRVVAYRNGLRFMVPAAEALQSGSMGQLIKVRNTQSNKIITARVTGRGVVEVPL